MKKLTAIAVALVTLSGCSLLGGPSSKQIEDLARRDMIKNLGTGDANQRAALLAAAQMATVTKKGLCNHDSTQDSYACAVDVTIKMRGAAQETTQTFVVVTKKAADGTWADVG